MRNALLAIFLLTAPAMAQEIDGEAPAVNAPPAAEIRSDYQRAQANVAPRATPSGPQAENRALKAQLAELTAAHAALEKQYAEDKAALDALRTELSNVEKLSNNAVALQEQNEELIKRNRMLQSEIDVLTASRDQLQGDNRQRWFMFGGLAVFLGALLAVLLPRLKPRRRYSEWA